MDWVGSRIKSLLRVGLGYELFNMGWVRTWLLPSITGDDFKRTSAFRRRHQALSRAISKMDGFMKFNNVGGFVCHIVNIIVILYSFIFYHDLKADAVSVAVSVFWLSINVKGLVLATSSSVLINHMVRVAICLLVRYVRILVYALPSCGRWKFIKVSYNVADNK